MVRLIRSLVVCKLVNNILIENLLYKLDKMSLFLLLIRRRIIFGPLFMFGNSKVVLVLDHNVKDFGCARLCLFLVQPALVEVF